MILIIDNYDSFTYNLVQRLGELDCSLEITVFRNDEISVDEIAARKPTHLIISPGPCTPNEAGVSVDSVRYFHSRIPILGVCLGHQSIGQATGGRIVRAAHLMHGKTDNIHHDGTSIFTGLPNPMIATRYHSLVIQPESLSPEFRINAWTMNADGTKVIMGVEHLTYATFGVQFHPESFLTECGSDLLRNFIETKTS